MIYVDVLWLHTDDALPVRIVSELDAQRYEVRKLEFFRTRGVGFAESDFAFGSTELDPAPVPELPQINADTRRHGAEISAQEFEALWRQYASA
ncbi:hypothetical protein GJ700_17615 [Duganella sp. FT92W]|uniref:DUF6881 domain-containing protein n=1 Tax=Pseudoduganella rivuli TaxID=2666085 RepID=A0A7X2IP97_9BURK|nr:hypothetical protein [Pseudoduganella rivuli]